MALRLEIHPLALVDQDEHFEYLRAAQVGAETLRKFNRAIREAKRKIRLNPETWSFVPGSRRMRKVQIRGFRMQAFYFIQSNGVPLLIEFAGAGLQPRWRARL